MNPSPFGMAQTAVPFGDPAIVRDVLGLCRRSLSAGNPTSKRPILGPDSTRKEVSGQRVWSWVQNDWGAPRLHEARSHHHYCPLCFMEESGRNRTPDKLKKHERMASAPHVMPLKVGLLITNQAGSLVSVRMRNGALNAYSATQGSKSDAFFTQVRQPGRNRLRPRRRTIARSRDRCRLTIDPAVPQSR